jgi:molecular chaperone GrpE
LRHTRSLASCKQSAPRNLLTRPQFRPANVALAPVSRPLAARFYATEPESKAAEGEAAAAEGAKENGAEAEAEDPMKKELEAKNKEIIDLKVCADIAPLQTTRLIIHRIATCAL